MSSQHADSGARCRACDGFKGQCEECGGSDWCLHWHEGYVGEDVAVCCDCSQDYQRHKFVREPDEGDRDNYVDKMDLVYSK